MARHEVALVGWHEPGLGGLPGNPVRVELDRALDGGLRGFRVIVVGDRAIDKLDPVRFQRATRRLRSPILLCPEQCVPHRLARWVEFGVGSTVTVADLPRRLRRLIAAPSRPRRLRLREWFGRTQGLSVEARRVLKLLPASHPLQVHAWASRGGMTLEQLHDFCVEELDLLARDILWRYVETVVRDARARGATWTKCAHLVEYSDASTLMRGFRRRDRPLPPATA